MQIVKESPSLVHKIILISIIPLVVVIAQVYKFQSLVTFVYIPLLFFISLHLNSFNLVVSKPLKLYLLFFILSLLSAITAKHLDLYISESKTALGNIIFGLTLFNLIIHNPKNAKYLFISYIISTYFFSFYLFKNGAFNVSAITDDKYRIEDEVFNANLFSYYIYLALFSFYFLFEIYKQKLLLLVYIASIILYVIVIFLSGSRGGLLMFFLVNVLYWVFIGFVKYPKIIKPTIISALILIFCLPILSLGFYYVLEQTNIGYRYSKLFEEGEETPRMILLRYAIDNFLSNPVLGVGSGNFAALNPQRQFSHNNFIEILVNNGVFAFILYITSFLVLVKQSFFLLRRSFSVSEKKLFAVVLLFVITFFIYSFFYVFARVIPYTGFIFIAFAIVYVLKSLRLKDKGSISELF